MLYWNTIGININRKDAVIEHKNSINQHTHFLQRNFTWREYLQWVYVGTPFLSPATIQLVNNDVDVLSHHTDLSRNLNGLSTSPHGINPGDQIKQQEPC